MGVKAWASGYEENRQNMKPKDKFYKILDIWEHNRFILNIQANIDTIAWLVVYGIIFAFVTYMIFDRMHFIWAPEIATPIRR